MTRSSKQKAPPTDQPQAGLLYALLAVFRALWDRSGANHSSLFSNCSTDSSARPCRCSTSSNSEVSPAGLEPATFGSGGRRPGRGTLYGENKLRQTGVVGVPTMVPSDSEIAFDAEIGAELAQVVTAWPTLPASMRQGILAMIQAAASADPAS